MPVDPMIARPYVPQFGNTLGEIARTKVADDYRNALMEQERREHAFRQQQYYDQQAQEDEDDREWDTAYAARDWATLARLDPQTTRVLMEHEKAQQPAPVPGPITTERQPDGAAFYLQDGKVVGSRMPLAPQYAPAGYREVTLMENGKPVAYMVNERNPSDRVKLGETQGRGGNEIGGGVGNPFAMNERQRAGLSMQRANAITYAANLTGTDRAEIERILATEGPDGVYRVMIERGRRKLQGAPARIAQSLPFGKTIVEATNADLIAPAKGGGAGIALMQNPTGPVATADFQAGEAQFPSAIYPLQTQAEMIRQMLQGEQGSPQPAAGAAPAGGLTPEEKAELEALRRRFRGR